MFNRLEFGGLSVKVSMFADDTLIFLNRLENQFSRCYHSYKTIQRQIRSVSDKLALCTVCSAASSGNELCQLVTLNGIKTSTVELQYILI